MKTTTFLLLLMILGAWSCKKGELISPSSSKSTTNVTEKSVSTSALIIQPPDININPIPDGDYWIHCKGGFGVLDVPNGDTADRVIIQQYAWHGVGVSPDNQVWSVKYLYNGYYSIISYKTGKSLDVPSGSKIFGLKIQQYNYNGGLNQQWTIGKTVSTGLIRIYNRQSGLALEIPTAISGTQLQQATPNKYLNSQVWEFWPWVPFNNI